MDSTQAIVDFVAAVQKHALPFLVAITAIGTLGMAVIETVKKIYPFRKRFNRHFLKKWLKTCATQAPTFGTFSAPPDPVAAEKDLVRLATSNDRNAFYDLSTDKLCGQANAAAQAALDSPLRHVDLLRCLAATAEAEDLALVFQPMPGPGAAMPADLPQARARVVHQIQRGLDSIQISAAAKWERWNQRAGFIACFLLTEFALLWFVSRRDSTGGAWLGYTIKVIIVSVVAGVLAPVAKDLKTAIEQLKAR